MSHAEEGWHCDGVKPKSRVVHLSKTPQVGIALLGALANHGEKEYSRYWMNFDQSTHCMDYLQGSYSTSTEEPAFQVP